MARRVMPLVMILVLLTTLAGTVQARAPTSGAPSTALLSVAVPDDAALARFAATGLPAYTRPRDGSLLTGAGPAGRLRLALAGLSCRVLDPDMAGAAYYLAYAMPGRPAPDWDAYGQLLLADGGAVLLRAEPAAAEQLALAGAELAQLTLDPKPLRPAAEGTFPTVITPDPLIQSMLDQVVSSTVYQYTGDLSGEWPVTIGGSPYTIATRHTNSGTPIQKATQFVGEHLEDLGLAVEYHQWGGATYPNVIGTYTGTINPGDIYILCAHLDDMPSGPLAPGADDNASGAVATWLAAEILTQYQWGCTLRFAFWTGEEQGLLGSAAYAQRAYNRGENILGVLNLDMIAWDDIGGPDFDLHADSSMPPTLELAQLFADVVDAYNLDLIPHIIPNGIPNSDHSSFWNYGYIAILGIEYYSGGDFNDYYHTTNDLLEYLNMPYYTDFVKASLGTFAHMSGCLIPGGLGALDGHVTAASGGAPIAGATVVAQDAAGHSFPATTDGSGYYTRTLLAGTYTATASAYGYLPALAGGVVIVTDTVTTQDFALQTAPTYVVSGTVSEAGTGLPLFAEITFDGSPEVVWTDPASGYYSATLPEGAYTMHVRADLHEPAERAIVLDHDQTQDFALDPLPCILLVDDDNNSPDTRPYFTAALDNLGYGYNVFDVGGGGSNGPTLAELQGYSIVIWFSGDNYGNAAGPNGTDETALAAYLDGGGHLFLSSQDYLYDFGLTPFGQSYLGIGSFDNDDGNASTKYGVPGDPIGDGLGPYPLTYPANFSDYGDIVSAGAGASVAFRSAAGGGNNLDVDKDGGAWRTVFFGTDWVPIYNANAANGRQVLQRVVDWFGGCEPQIGWLVGQVTDAASGLPLEGAEVTVVPGQFVRAPTDPNGHYTFTLPAGLYDVTAQLSGYYPQTAPDVEVQTGLTTTQDFSLLPIVSTPTIVVSPTAFDVTLYSGQQSDAPLSIANEGGAPLAYTLTEAPAVDWLAADPLSGTVDPAASADVTLTFDAAGLDPTLYTTTVQVHSNDPLSPLVVVPVTLTVLEPVCVPVGDVAFSWEPAQPLAGQVITFTGSATGTPPITYTWIRSLSFLGLMAHTQ